MKRKEKDLTSRLLPPILDPKSALPTLKSPWSLSRISFTTSSRACCKKTHQTLYEKYYILTKSAAWDHNKSPKTKRCFKMFVWKTEGVKCVKLSVNWKDCNTHWALLRLTWTLWGSPVILRGLSAPVGMGSSWIIIICTPVLSCRGTNKQEQKNTSKSYLGPGNHSLWKEIKKKGNSATFWQFIPTREWLIQVIWNLCHQCVVKINIIQCEQIKKKTKQESSNFFMRVQNYLLMIIMTITPHAALFVLNGTKHVSVNLLVSLPSLCTSFKCDLQQCDKQHKVREKKLSAMSFCILNYLTC